MKKFLFSLMSTAAYLVTSGAGAETLRFAIQTEAPAVDPHWSTNLTAIEAGRHVFDHLILQDKDMKLTPGLAESWRIIDDKTWEFKLRPNVKWHDGSPFTADDVLFTMERAYSIVSPNSFKQYLADKKGTKVDDLTIVIKTDNPNPLVDTDVASFAIVSKKHATGATQADFVSGKATIGTGPYKFVSFKSGDSLNLTANPSYWGGKPIWDEVIFKPIGSAPTRVAALRAGDVDVIDKVPTTDLAGLKADAKFVVSEGPGNRPFYVWIDSRKDITPDVTDNDGKPIIPNPLRDWRVRAALSKAINREAIVERVFEKSASPTMQLLPDGFYGFNSDLKVAGEYDPAAAKKLLADAGYPNGFKTVLHGTAGRYVNDAKFIEAVAQMWTQVGIKTEVRTYPAQVFFEKTSKMELSTALRTYTVATGEPSIQLRAIVHTNPLPGTNFCCDPSGYSNLRTDEMIETAMKTMDAAKRGQIWKDVIGIAVKDYGIAGVYFEYYSWASKAGLKYNVRLDNLNLAQDVVKK